ncbi:hypothetical protein CLCAR_3165 [Clostridium carboxidivorans P7]|nr:hypothetical protein CLCAR_3165 [Clostridium carboxidivorans P7]
MRKAFILNALGDIIKNDNIFRNGYYGEVLWRKRKKYIMLLA